ncbi:MAG: hypothetical protein PHI24_14675, partial [Desulfitobacteriaceae bacterium]|nr:hypothetical protein [Desulfitobacteriaceae bacterium]
MGLIGEIFATAGLHVDNASFSKYESELKAAEGQISEFSNTSQTLLAGAFTMPAVAMGGVIKYGTELASSFEDASTTLTTVYGGLDIATEKFQWLADFAATTPFDFPELLDATVKLKSYGIEAEEYMGTLGDASSAMGKTLDQTVEAVADAMTGQFERMKEYGIKAIEVNKSNYKQLGVELSQVGMTALSYTNKAGEQVAKAVDRNNKQMVLSTLQNIWDIEKGFKGAMEERSRTLSGVMGALKDNLTMGLADFIGFSMSDMEVQTLSLLNVFKELANVAVYLTDGLSSIPEPIQAIITVSALGAAGLGLMVAGFMAYNAILPLATANTKIFGYALSEAIWPATAVVLGLALVAGGLVYLEEKTGLVSTAWTFFIDSLTLGIEGFRRVGEWIYGTLSDMWDALKEMFSDGFIGDILRDFEEPLATITEKTSGFLDRWHEAAEEIRRDNDDIKESTVETADSVVTAGQVADEANSAWSLSSYGLASDVEDAYKRITDSMDTAKSEYQKALESFLGDQAKTEGAGIDIISGKFSITDLTRGIKTLNDELIILDDNLELVKVSADGTVTPLKGIGEISFQTTRGGLTILTKDVDDTGQSLERADKLVGQLKQSVVILDGSTLSNAHYEGLKLKSIYDESTNSVSLLNGQIGLTDNGTLININQQVETLDSSIISSTDDTYDLNSTLNTTNIIPMSEILSNTDQINDNLIDDNESAGNLNDTLIDTNYTPFGTINPNLVGIGKKLDDDKIKTDNLNSSMDTLGGFSFSTTLSSLGSIWDKLGNIYDKAKSAVSELSKIGSSSGGGSSGKTSSVKKTDNSSTNNN